MYHLLVGLAQWLNDTQISTYLRENDWAFPIIESVHLLSLGASVGTILWLDLRLLGLTYSDVSLPEVIQGIEPWAIGGFSAMFASGFLLILAEPLKCATNWTFGLKMLGVLMAGVNVLYFHKKIMPDIGEHKLDQELTWQAKMVGGTSLVLWLAIIVLGRWFAYF